MKLLVSALTLSVCALQPALVQAAVTYDPATQVLTDSAAGRAWVLDGIGFCCSYAFPGFANEWVAGLNQSQHAGHADWRLPTVDAPADGMAPPQSSGELGQLFDSLTLAYPDRNDWPFGLGASDYGGRIIYSDAAVPTQAGQYWGLNFLDGTYRPIYVGYAYAYVGVMAVRAVPEPGTWALWLGGLLVAGSVAARRKEGRSPLQRTAA